MIIPQDLERITIIYSMKNVALISFVGFIGLLFILYLPGCQSNHAPTIVDIQIIKILDSEPLAFHLSVLADDEDGDSLEIEWFSPAGEFPLGTGSESIRWQSPISFADQDYPVVVTVSDLEYSACDTVVLHVPHSFNPTFTDSRDGYVYPLVKIGSQIWMAKNLNYNSTYGSFCYEDDTSNCDRYGRLYDWETALTACPNGWHLPSLDEWLDLLEWASPNPGLNLKSISGWNENGNGRDSFGFAVLPAGRLYAGEHYGHIGFHTSLWSSDEKDANQAGYIRFEYFHDGFNEFNADKWTSAFSVRCIQDK